MTTNQSDVYKILATAGLILLDAMIMHEILARKYSNVRTLSAIRSSFNVKRALEDEWRKVLRIDYEPVFSIAVNILETLPSTPGINDALARISEVAEDLAGSRVLLKHDLFGRVYHQLLLGKLAKYYATYYTSIPAARLLARLLVNLPSPLNAKDVPPTYDGEPVKVADFACGSGTLLSAMYKELMLRHMLDAQAPRSLDMHRYLIEEGLWGFDVLYHAAHLATTTLFLHEPDQPVSRARIFVLGLGVYDRELLGSIELLRSRKLGAQQLLQGAMVGARRLGVEESAIESVEVPDFHYVIMNPPFTRSVGGNLLFGGLPSGIRKRLQEALRRLLRERGLTGIGQAGLGAVFVFLADKYLKPGGRIGLVLPKAVLSGESWRKVREKLLSDYHIEYVISSFEAPNDWNFSENTDLSEVLLVARKLGKSEKNGKRYTFFVNLWRKPRNEVESIFIGSQLIKLYGNPEIFDITNSNTSSFNLKLRGGIIGEVYSAMIDEVDFGHLTFFAQSELNRVVTLLRKGIIYSPRRGIAGYIPLKPLSEFIKDIGPDVRQVHSVFKTGPGAFKAFWGHDSNIVTRLEQKPNSTLTPKPGKAQAARQLWSKSGRLLIVERAWLPTYRLLAVRVEERVLSNVWWPIVVQDEDTEKLLALWLNSTYGTLLLLSIAEVTRGPWIKFKKGKLRELPVIDLTKLKDDAKSKLLLLYKEISEKSTSAFKPIPQEFADPEVRAEIDGAWNEALDLDVDLSDIYEMLARDPVITGQPLT